MTYSLATDYYEKLDQLSERASEREGEREREREGGREREVGGERENSNSDSKTLYYKDSSLGSVKNLSNY